MYVTALLLTTVTSFLPSGKLLWSRATELEQGQPPAFFFNTPPLLVPSVPLFLASGSNNSLNGVSVATGEIEWSIQTLWREDEIQIFVGSSSLALGFAGHRSDQEQGLFLTAVNPANGKYAWDPKLKKRNIYVGGLPKAAYADNLLLVAGGGTADASVNAYSGSEGVLLWNISTQSLGPPLPERGDLWYVEMAAVGMGAAFIGIESGDNSVDGTVTALDMKDGSSLWSVTGTATEAFLFSTSSTIANGNLNTNGNIVLLTLDRRPASTPDARGALLIGVSVSTGKVLWRREDAIGDGVVLSLGLKAACLHNCTLPCELLYTNHFGIIDPTTGRTTPYNSTLASSTTSANQVHGSATQVTNKSSIATSR
jgi:outer membrane protein assembly factor BamB